MRLIGIFLLCVFNCCQLLSNLGYRGEKCVREKVFLESVLNTFFKAIKEATKMNS